MRHQDRPGLGRTQREVPISSERLPRLRLAIQTSRLSFPAQVPVFSRQYRPDAQWRIATLYLVQGWSCERLAERYGVTRGRIRQVIRRWVERAEALGYLQRIPPKARLGIGIKRSRAAASAIQTSGSPLSAVATVQAYPLQAWNAGPACIQTSVDRPHKDH